MDRQTKKTKSTKRKMPGPSQRKQPLSIQAHLPGWTTQKNPNKSKQYPMPGTASGSLLLW